MHYILRIHGRPYIINDNTFQFAMANASHWFSNYFEHTRRLKVINEHSYLYNFFFKQHMMYFVKCHTLHQVNPSNASNEFTYVYGRDKKRKKLTDKPNVNEGWRVRVDHPAHINKDGHQLKATPVLEASSWVWYVASTPWIP